MNRMRLHTRLAPGLWLSQPITCGSCLVIVFVLSFIGMCLAGGFLASLDSFLRQFALTLIQMWGR